MRVGVFDSGLGGLTIVRQLQRQLHGVDIYYLADTLNAPYGEKPVAEIERNSLAVADYLRRQHTIDALVVACNTATSAAIDALRRQHPDLPIIGTEPAVKPALALSRGDRVGVLATPATLQGAKYRQLVDRLTAEHKVHILEQACHGLVAQIEKGETDSAQTLAMLSTWLVPMRDLGVDTLVLGCTHYPLIGDAIHKVMGRPMNLVDSAEGVSRQLINRLVQRGFINQGATRLHLQVTGAINRPMLRRILGGDYPDPTRVSIDNSTGEPECSLTLCEEC